MKKVYARLMVEFLNLSDLDVIRTSDGGDPAKSDDFDVQKL